MIICPLISGCHNKNLKNTEELIEEFEKGGVKVRQQEKMEKKKRTRQIQEDEITREVYN